VTRGLRPLALAVDLNLSVELFRLLDGELRVEIHVCMMLVSIEPHEMVELYTYLNTRNLVGQEVHQESVRDLTTPMLHLLQHCCLGRL